MAAGGRKKYKHAFEIKKNLNLSPGSLYLFTYYDYYTRYLDL